MKPDWKDAPEWANWLAQDRNGTWWWYEKPPSTNSVYQTWWVPNERGRLMPAVDETEWKDSLERRPNM